MVTGELPVYDKRVGLIMKYPDGCDHASTCEGCPLPDCRKSGKVATRGSWGLSEETVSRIVTLASQRRSIKSISRDTEVSRSSIRHHIRKAVADGRLKQCQRLPV